MVVKGTKLTHSNNYRHGMKGTRPYRIWVGIRTRCLNKGNPDYKNYGGRGIRMCEDWKDFVNFWNDMSGTYFEGATIERIDNNGDYCKENCEWITRGEQNKNKRTVKIYSFNGKSQDLADWGRELNIDRRTLWLRIKNGWSVERAFTKPTHKANLRTER